MQRRVYDFVFGLGPACSCSQSLRAAGLQLTSLPFDWNGLQTIADRRMLIESDFADWMRREDFERVPEEIAGRSNFWVNHRIRCSFAHDFKQEAISEAEIAAVAEKYRRRIERMKSLIAASHRVLVVWVQIGSFPEPAVSEMSSFRSWAEARWPGIRFDMLFFRWRQGVPMARAEDSEADGVRIVSFDYQDKRQKLWFADHDMVGGWLRRHYAVRDYRTADEKARWRRQVREKKFARFGVRTWLGYFYARSIHALRKHFEKGRAD